MILFGTPSKKARKLLTNLSNLPKKQKTPLRKTTRSSQKPLKWPQTTKKKFLNDQKGSYKDPNPSKEDQKPPQQHNKVLKLVTPGQNTL